MFNRITWVDQLHAEVQRVSELLPLYDAAPALALFASAARKSLERAGMAAIRGDFAAIREAYEELQDYSA